MSALLQPIFFKINPDTSSELVLKNLLASVCKVAYLSTKKDRLTFYDTFEWQAYENGFVVYKKKNHLILADLHSRNEACSTAFQRLPFSFFPKYLPDCTLREQLCSFTDVRGFFRLCTVEEHIRSYRIMDDNDKTIGILSSTSLSIADRKKENPLTQYFSIRPLKGYQKEIFDIEKVFASYEELGRVLDFKELFLSIMKAVDHNVLGYSTKIDLNLDADAPIYTSAQRLLQFTLSVMRQNEAGIRKNIDSEFLHDFRVAIRRTRSVIKQLKGVFDPDETTRYLDFFKELGKLTNELRDLDVYLLRRETYYDYLPLFLQPPLPLFFNDIEASHRLLHKKFCRFLGSSSYTTFITEWNHVIKRELLPDADKAPNAALSTKTVAVDSIKKAWRKVIRHGRHVSKETTDSELHALRIDCKKLRYLLEFFSSIFPQNTIIPVIKQLKELQENLGDFVDFAVQVEFLHKRLEVLSSGGEKSLLAASMGGLMATLFQKQEEARRKFHRTFRLFDHDETSQLFHDLLTSNSAT